MVDEMEYYKHLRANAAHIVQAKDDDENIIQFPLALQWAQIDLRTCPSI